MVKEDHNHEVVMTKISSKQFQAYKKSRIEGLSFNESYNLSVLGISTSEYKFIDKLVYSLRGILGPMPTLRQLNDEIKKVG